MQRLVYMSGELCDLRQTLPTPTSLSGAVYGASMDERMWLGIIEVEWSKPLDVTRMAL